VLSTFNKYSGKIRHPSARNMTLYVIIVNADFGYKNAAKYGKQKKFN
jgi:hypothetical protein